MSYGPCGGVRNDGGCEVDQRPCPFPERPMTVPEHRPSAAVTWPDPAIVVDVRSPIGWVGDSHALWRRTAATLSGCVALIGEHVDNPVRQDDSGPLATEEVIAILRDGGVATIVTVTGRDRDLPDARRLIERYHHAGALAVHCVTGDHPAALDIKRPARFGAESMSLIGVCAALQVPATVAESPTSPGPRPQRLAAKQLAGASGCILNHGGDAHELVAFADSCRDAGASLPLLAPVPMVADKHAALALAAFPGVRLPTGYLDLIIDAVDASEAALVAMEQLTSNLWHSGRFIGINLSGGGRGTDPWGRLDTTAQFVDRARTAWRRAGHRAEGTARTRSGHAD